MPNQSSGSSGFMAVTASVGQNGANKRQDVATVQLLLNRVARRHGTRNDILKVDGIAGPKTLEAIRTFQTRFVKTLPAADGRVDPNQVTILQLNSVAGPLPPLNNGMSYLHPEGHRSGFA